METDCNVERLNARCLTAGFRGSFRLGQRRHMLCPRKGPVAEGSRVDPWWSLTLSVLWFFLICKIG